MKKIVLPFAVVVLSLSAFAGTACKNCGVSEGNVIYQCDNGHINCSKCMKKVPLSFDYVTGIGNCRRCGAKIERDSMIVDNRSGDEQDEPRRPRRQQRDRQYQSEDSNQPQQSSGEKIYTSVDAEIILDIMKKQGYEVQLDKDCDIEWDINGVKCRIIFDDGRKKQSNFFFACTFSIDPSSAANAIVKCNEYNRKAKFGTCYVGKKNNSVTYQLTLNLRGGVTEARIIDFFDDCKQLLGHWRKSIFGK